MRKIVNATILCKTCNRVISKEKHIAWSSYIKKQFCSKECHDTYQRRNMTKVKCLICGNEFLVSASKQKRYRTCSSKCREIYYKKIVNPYRYKLSQKIESKKKRNKTFMDKRIAVECACGCGEVFKITEARYKLNVTGKHFKNRKHYENWFRGENCTFFLGGHTNYYGADWRKQRKLARKRDVICQHCGKTKQENGKELDVHHIIPFRYFNKSEEANKLDNLITLCIKCHRNTNKAQFNYIKLGNT